MNIAIVLASGKGTRIQSQIIPKQFVEIRNKPIFIHTIEKFLMNGNIDKIIVVVSKDWINFAKESINNFFKNHNNIYITCGGSSRSESLMNGYKFIKENLKPKDNDIILTHDSVRMFVNNKIINDNINELLNNHEYVIDTCVRAIDTIVKSDDNQIISDIPNRDHYYYGQTPQSCSFKVLDKIFSNKYDQTIFNNCDLCKLAQLSNIKIKIVDGDYFNFKITTDFDLIKLSIVVDVEK